MGTELDRVWRDKDEVLARQEENSPAAWQDMRAPWSPPKAFFTFRYSSTEIFSEGNNLHVKVRETRYEDGRLKSEECEGTLDRQAYGRMMNEAQGYFLNQVADFTRMLLAPLLPSPPRRRPYDE